MHPHNSGGRNSRLPQVPAPGNKEQSAMFRANKGLVVLCVAAFGLWGCAQGSAGGAAERIKALETKCSKLEDDYQAAAAARDAAKRKASAFEHERDQIRQELDQQLTARTAERDAANAQFEQFRKNLRMLLGQADAAAGITSPPPTVSATEPVNPNKS
jgi:Spy/CpxP family protein refolding chaperone